MLPDSHPLHRLQVCIRDGWLPETPTRIRAGLIGGDHDTIERCLDMVERVAELMPGLVDETRTCRCGVRFAPGKSDLRNEEYNDHVLCRKCGEVYAVRVHGATWPVSAKTATSRP